MIDCARERWVLDLIEGSPIASVICNPRLPDNPVVAYNQAFTELTLYSGGEIIGRNCRVLAGRDTEPSLRCAMREAIGERRPAMVELLNYKRDGTPFRNAICVAPIYSANQELIYFLGSLVELGQDAHGFDRFRQSASRKAVQSLSKRQFEVLRLVAYGLRNKQIAHELGLTEKTVKMHRAITMEKLGVRTAAEMIRMAVEAGI